MSSNDINVKVSITSYGALPQLSRSETSMETISYNNLLPNQFVLDEKSKKDIDIMTDDKYDDKEKQAAYAKLFLTNQVKNQKAGVV